MSCSCRSDRALELGQLALLCAVRGRLREAVRHATEAGQPGVAALGLVHCLRGDVDAAHQVLARSDGDTSPALALVRARVLRARGDLAGARTLLGPVRDLASAQPLPPLLGAWLTIVDSELWLAGGQPLAAMSTLGPLLSASPPGPLTGLARVTAARAHLACGAPTRARSLLVPLLRRDLADDLAARVNGWLVDAAAANQLGQPGAVCVAMAEALSAAAAEGLRGPFLDADPALLRRHRDLLDAHRPFTDGLGVGRPTQHRDRPGLPEPITERETVVLRYLPTLLTTGDIARELCVSPNTVKSQVKSLYRKLAVGTRRDAVHRARVFGLL